MNVWLFNAYHTGSHRAWAEGYAAHSRHQVRIFSMAGRFWKWRLQGGAMEFAHQAQAQLLAGEAPDVLLASSMVNLPALLALLRRFPAISRAPVVLYMHENQLTYPPPPGTKRDLTYGLIQHLSMLAADRVCFNSSYHLESWFEELPRLLKHFPDYNHLATVQTTRAKAQVLPVGCDLERYDAYRPASPAEDTPVILWNQRWEYDKDPAAMLEALRALANQGENFRVALAGENFRVVPAEFAEAREWLGDRLIHYGYADSESDYARLLWGARVVLSTAIHEFFGVGVIEAMYCGCHPVLPRRLSYPELVPATCHTICLYNDSSEMLAQLRTALKRPQALPALRAAAQRFEWAFQAPAYDALLKEVRKSVLLQEDAALPHSPPAPRGRCSPD